MQTDIVYKILWIFFLYSFLGWVLETAVAAVKKRKFVNRGVLNGPVCCIYGITALVLWVGMEDLKNSWVFLFIGCMSVATVIEWAAGRLLERLHHHRWWDYSEKRWNLDGYICLEYSLLWGTMGMISLKYVNSLFVELYRMLPFSVVRLLLWIALVLLIIDGAGSSVAIWHMAGRMPGVERVNNRIASATLRIGSWIAGRVEKRMLKGHPTIAEETERTDKPEVFAQGCSFYKLVALFFIGAFLGDITETIFCRLTAGVWTSRSSVVWGPFSIVWGLAIMLATLILYNYRNRPDGFIFAFGTVLGGVYEYLCSVFTELAFGKVFWDYSEIPFNLGGRINLLYCFFWGIAAVVWLKLLYPMLSRYIEKIPMKVGKIFSWILIIFMVVNCCVSVMALSRYLAREQGKPAQSAWEQSMDEHFGDARMKQIYPNAIPAE